MTNEEMCQYICRWLKEKHGIEQTPEQVWQTSPSGELWPVYALYDQAQREMGGAACSCNEANPSVGQLCVKCNGMFAGQRWVYRDKPEKVVPA